MSAAGIAGQCMSRANQARAESDMRVTGFIQACAELDMTVTGLTADAPERSVANTDWSTAVAGTPRGVVRRATPVTGVAVSASDPPLTKLQVLPAVPVFVVAISLLTLPPAPVWKSVPVLAPVAPETVS